MGVPILISTEGFPRPHTQIFSEMLIYRVVQNTLARLRELVPSSVESSRNQADIFWTTLISGIATYLARFLSAPQLELSLSPPHFKMYRPLETKSPESPGDSY